MRIYIDDLNSFTVETYNRMRNKALERCCYSVPFMAWAYDRHDLDELLKTYSGDYIVMRECVRFAEETDALMFKLRIK